MYILCQYIVLHCQNQYVWKMSRKGNEVSLSELIYNWYIEGKSYLEISKLIKRSKSTVQYVIKNVKLSGDVLNRQRKGAPKKLILREERAAIKEIKKKSDY